MRAAAAQAHILRAGALGGLTRLAGSPRLRSGAMHIRGSKKRLLSWVHEADLADLIVEALTAPSAVPEIVNVVAPSFPTIAHFHQRVATEIGLPLTVTDDGGFMAERRVVSSLLPARAWRPWWV